MSSHIPFNIHNRNYSGRPNESVIREYIIGLITNTNLDSVLQDSIDNDEGLVRDENVVAQFDSQKYKDIEKSKYDSNCGICLETYNGDEDVVILDCSHLYHKKCIDEWIHYNQVCPLCKKNIDINK